MSGSEQKIFDRSDEGNLERGFRLIMDLYQERLYRAFRQMLDSHEDANDVLQNTFLKAFESIGTFRRKSTLYTWIYRIGFHECMSVLKQRSKNPLSLIDGDPPRQDEDSGVDLDVVRKELKIVLDQLPEKQRLVFEMRYREQIKYQEISEMTGTSIGALKASYHQAIRKIKSHFAQKKII